MNPIIIPTSRCHISVKSTVRHFVLAACVIAVAGTWSSCSTARGFGQDVEKTGDKIQNAAVRAD